MHRDISTSAGKKKREKGHFAVLRARVRGGSARGSRLGGAGEWREASCAAGPRADAGGGCRARSPADLRSEEWIQLAEGARYVLVLYSLLRNYSTRANAL